jgi:hypothetical protein
VARSDDDVVAQRGGRCGLVGGRSDHTKIVLAGYSQGAAAVREGEGFVQERDTDMVQALVLVADPWNDPNAGGFHIRPRCSRRALSTDRALRPGGRRRGQRARPLA